MRATVTHEHEAVPELVQGGTEVDQIADATTFPSDIFSVGAVDDFFSDVALLGGLVPWWVPPVLVLLVLLGIISAYAFYRSVRQHRRTWPSMHTRIMLRMWPGPGFADWWNLTRDYGRWRARRVARKKRPSLSVRDRLFGPANAYSVYHGKAYGWFGLRFKVWSSFEDNTVNFAPPQEGKSVSAVSKIWAAPGAAVINTIRGDLLAASAGYRKQFGKIVVFNPGHIGEHGSTFKWDPLRGCRSFDVAMSRAGYMVEAIDNKGLDGSFWQDNASMVLASLLHAAALVMDDQERGVLREGQEWDQALPEPVSMKTLYTWATTASLVPYEVLRLHPSSNRAALEFLLGFFTRTPERTRDSVIFTLRHVLQFMLDESIVKMITPRPGEPTFDAKSFVRSQDTLYLISPRADGRSPIAPLMSAFLAELYSTAVDESERAPLDPPLTVVLDEAANTVPVPLPSWTSYSAGSGIVLHLYGQSLTQFVRCWGEKGTGEILTNCKFVTLWPSVRGETRELLLTMAGKVRLVRKRGDKEDRRSGQSPYETWENALANPGQDIPDGFVVASMREKRPVALQPPKYWTDKRFTGHELPSLPPVQPRRAPEAIPELLDNLGHDRNNEVSTRQLPREGGDRPEVSGRPEVAGRDWDPLSEIEADL